MADRGAMFPIRDHNPSGRTPYVTYTLLLGNIAVFLLTVTVFDTPRELNELYWDYALLPQRVSDGEGYFGLVTSMFLHGGWMHLAGNMLFLWIFGDNVEDIMGHVQFAVFYLAAGVAAGLGQYIVDIHSLVPMVGASGAIAGVMGAYLLLFPKAKVDILIILIVFFRIFPVPAWIMLMLWFGMQFLGGLGSDPTQGGVAYWAHAGGFIAGLVLAIPYWLRRGGPAFWQATDGHPPNPAATYPIQTSNIPKVKRK